MSERERECVCERERERERGERERECVYACIYGGNGWTEGRYVKYVLVKSTHALIGFRV